MRNLVEFTFTQFPTKTGGMGDWYTQRSAGKIFDTPICSGGSLFLKAEKL
jgi:hypothetical protein